MYDEVGNIGGRKEEGWKKKKGLEKTEENVGNTAGDWVGKFLENLHLTNSSLGIILIVSKKILRKQARIINRKPKF